jgi:hypothetical protein
MGFFHAKIVSNEIKLKFLNNSGETDVNHGNYR